MKQNKLQQLDLCLKNGGLKFIGQNSEKFNKNFRQNPYLEIIKEVASRTRGDRIASGTVASVELLCKNICSQRHGERLIKDLVEAGLVKRVRDQSGKKNNKREAPARNLINPALLDAAAAWAEARAMLSGGDKYKLPARELLLPADWDSEPPTPGKPALARVSEGPTDKMTVGPTDKMSEGIKHTPALSQAPTATRPLQATQPPQAPPPKASTPPQASPPKAPTPPQAQPPKAPTPLQALASPTSPPAPGGAGGGVSSSVATGLVTVTTPGAIDVNPDAIRFFQFFQQLKVNWWRVDAQTRDDSLKRGPPLGKFFGSKFPWPAFKAARQAVLLEERIKFDKQKRGILGIDLVCFESPFVDNNSKIKIETRKTILIDDLDGIQIGNLLEWWKGSVAVIETSHNNHQAILVTCPLRPDNHLRATRWISQKFYGDPGALSSGQPHRFPGSRNYKAECIDAGGPFVTKLTVLRNGSLRDGWLQIKELLKCEITVQVTKKISQVTNVPATKSAARNGVGSNSERAFGWTISQLRAGAPDNQILLGLQHWISHHDPDDWPLRTLHNAKFALGREHQKYRSAQTIGDRT